jgi:hypothetical protein
VVLAAAQVQALAEPVVVPVVVPQAVVQVLAVVRQAVALLAARPVAEQLLAVVQQLARVVLLQAQVVRPLLAALPLQVVRQQPELAQPLQLVRQLPQRLPLQRLVWWLPVWRLQLSWLLRWPRKTMRL